MCRADARKVGLWLLVGILGALASAYLVKGFCGLVAGEERSDAVDLRLRWTEQRYFLRGQNPYDVWARHHPRGTAHGVPAPVGRDASVEPSLGNTEPAHPPWGYASGLLLFWTEWPAARSYYAALNLLALLVIAAWAYRVGASAGPVGGPLLAVAMLAIGGTCTALEVGQYGLIVVALLVAALRLDEAGHQAWSGLLVGLAMCKPTIAGPFFLALLVRRRYRAAGTAALYWAVTSLAVWLTVKTGPLEMLRQMVQMGGSIADHGTAGFTELLLATGLDGARATLAAMVLVLALLVPLMAWWPEKSLASAFVVAAVAGRLWTYHKNYDNVMLVFLLVALGALALQRNSRAAALGFLAVGLWLWLPPRLAGPTTVQVLQAFTWPVGLLALWLGQCQTTEGTADGVSASSFFRSVIPATRQGLARVVG
jgi:hypothetical protein